jgi:hypothetical protein
MNIAGVKDDIIQMMAGASIPIRVTSFNNDIRNFSSVDNLFTLLVHLGYLTYDIDAKTVSVPNREVGEVFIDALNDAGMNNVARSLTDSEQLLKEIWELDEEAVANALDKTHQTVSILDDSARVSGHVNPSSMSRAEGPDYNNEHALSYAISLALYYAQEYYTVIRELPSGKGFVDIAYIPRKAHADKPAMVVELKYDLSAEAAIAQIKANNYPAALAEYSGNLLLVGVNYDKESKKHSCVIDRLIK